MSSKMHDGYIPASKTGRITGGGYYPWGLSAVCAQCGKTYTRRRGWVFHRFADYKQHYFCGWNCMCAFDREHEKKGDK